LHKKYVFLPDFGFPYFILEEKEDGISKHSKKEFGDLGYTTFIILNGTPTRSCNKHSKIF